MRLAIFLILCTTMIVAQGIDIRSANLEYNGHLFSATSNLQNPESAYYHRGTNTIYVSNVAGTPTGKDGKGWLQKLSVKGKVLNSRWVTGLNAPKGIRIHGKTLWVSDIDQMIGVNIRSGKIVRKVFIPGSKFLNDIAITKRGDVLVSDMVANKIYKITSKGHSVFAEKDLNFPNGLLLRGKNLIVAAWGDNKKKGALYSLSLKTKKKKLISKPLGNLDGLEVDKKGHFLVSDWVAGKVYRISPRGKFTLLFYGFKGAADIGFIPRKNILLVPRMMENIVSAYNLNHYPKK